MRHCVFLCVLGCVHEYVCIRECVCALPTTALGAEINKWPPYISNLVFELWELQPPTLNPTNNMGTTTTATNSSSGGSSSSQQPSSSRSGEDGGAAPMFVVRVLYNKQPLELPGASEGAWLMCVWLAERQTY